MRLKVLTILIEPYKREHFPVPDPGPFTPSFTSWLLAASLAKNSNTVSGHANSWLKC
jgi:hypothetical protein